MTHDVFISYSSRDKAQADATCAALEAAGIRCWIAPRDIRPGVEYGETLVEAIDGCSVMVLVFSSSADASPQIRREVERAVSKSLPVVTMRIEDTRPTRSLEFFLSAVHWFDAFAPPLEKHFQKLAAVVQSLLPAPGAGLIKIDSDLARAKEKSARSNFMVSLLTLNFGMVVTVILLLMIAVWYTNYGRAPSLKYPFMGTWALESKSGPQALRCVDVTPFTVFETRIVMPRASLKIDEIKPVGDRWELTGHDESNGDIWPSATYKDITKDKMTLDAMGGEAICKLKRLD